MGGRTLYCAPVTNDGPGGVLTASDVAEPLLRALEHGGIGLSMLVQEPDGTLRRVYANPALARMLGYTHDELLAIDPAETVLASEWPRLDALRALEDPDAVIPHLEMTLVGKDGRKVSVETANARAMFQGRPAILTFIRDMTEIRRLQADLLQADRMAAVGTLAAGVAHEINNPLSYVMLHIERLHHRLDRLVPDTALRVKTAASLEAALEGATRVANIVRDLLSFARVETDQEGKVRPCEVLRSTLRVTGASLSTRAQVNDAVPRLPVVRGTQGQLGQVYLNLLTNAMQSFSSDDPKQNRVNVTGRDEGDNVFLDIEDNGCGIPPDIQRRVFEPFFTTRPPGSGTGLGLSMTRSILAGMGGGIHIASQPGEGTRVTVQLRRA